jgi:hypothetical protein
VVDSGPCLVAVRKMRWRSLIFPTTSGVPSPKRCWSSVPGGILDMMLDLRAELLHRSEQDQAVRRSPEPDWEIVAAVDADNFASLKEVVAKVG